MRDHQFGVRPLLRLRKAAIVGQMNLLSSNQFSSELMMSKVKAVVFDWAGTVVDYGSRAPASVFMEIFRRSGVEISVAQAREPMGKAKRDHIATIFAMEDVRQRWTEKHGAAPGESNIDELYENFLPLQKETLSDHCDIIPGALETVAACRERGIKIGGTTGYTRELMEVVLPAAKEQGYSPDVSLAADDVSAGRPAPWLLFEIARRLNIFPMSSFVKVDDTPVGIHAGNNAGAWTVGVTKSGNQLGLSNEEAESLESSELESRLTAANEVFKNAGAHYVIDSVADLLPVLDDIESRLAQGEKP